MTQFLQHVSDASTTGALYALYALGLGMVFGIMRLVNIAYGELVMAGGYALVLTPGLPLAARLAITIVTVVVLALAMERIVFRRVRGTTPTTLLVVSFAVSFGLQSVAQLAFDARPRGTVVSTEFAHAWTLGGVRVSVLSVVTVGVTFALLGSLGAFLKFSSVGVWMRASSEDLVAARMLGVRANLVVASAFAISGVLAAASAFLLVGQTGQVTPTVGVSAMLFGLVGAVIGGLGSLPGAVLGGFLLGALSVALQVLLPLPLRPFRDAFVFAGVFVLLAARPSGLVVARGMRTRV